MLSPCSTGSQFTAIQLPRNITTRIVSDNSQTSTRHRFAQNEKHTLTPNALQDEPKFCKHAVFIIIIICTWSMDCNQMQPNATTRHTGAILRESSFLGSKDRKYTLYKLYTALRTSSVAINIIIVVIVVVAPKVAGGRRACSRPTSSPCCASAIQAHDRLLFAL